MSYAAASALQTALFSMLSGDATLATLAPGGVYDAPVPGTPAGSYVVLGIEDALDRSDMSGGGAEHRVSLQVISAAPGFQTVKDAAARVDALLQGPLPPLGVGRVVAVWFLDARARRLEGGDLRRIELRYRIRIET